MAGVVGGDLGSSRQMCTGQNLNPKEARTGKDPPGDGSITNRAVSWAAAATVQAQKSRALKGGNRYSLACPRCWALLLEAEL